MLKVDSLLNTYWFSVSTIVHLVILRCIGGFPHIGYKCVHPGTRFFKVDMLGWEGVPVHVTAHHTNSFALITFTSNQPIFLPL